MNAVTEINYGQLALSLILFAIPLGLFAYYRIALVKTTIISVVRMLLQLSLVALYLEWVFEMNNAYINLLWVLIMMVVGVFTSIKRIGLNWRIFVWPFVIASVSSVLIIDTFFLGFVLKLDYVFESRYFIPITGMVLGNAMNHNIVGLSAYFKGLDEKTELYQFLLSNTGKPKLALRPFISEAILRALNPMIANMSVIGLISLPGMMTGQILGGSSPAIAIKYQILIMTAIFVGSTINLFLSIALSNKFLFDSYANLNDKLYKR